MRIRASSLTHTLQENLLTGEFVMEADTEQSGHYEKLVYNRNEVIKQFEKIISFSERLSEGNFFFNHCGI